MEMPFSDVCWSIEFIATSWEILISSLLTGPQSSLGAHLRQSDQGLRRDVSFALRRNEPDFIQNHHFRPSSCKCFAELTLLGIPVVVGRSITQPWGEPMYRHLPTPSAWKDLAEGSGLLYVHYMEIFAAETHFWDKNSA